MEEEEVKKVGVKEAETKVREVVEMMRVKEVKREVKKMGWRRRR